MSTMTIEKSEYDGLLKMKDQVASLKDAESENVDVKAENVKLKTEIEENNKFKEKVEAEKVEALKSEADTFIDTQIKANKMKPKFKEMKVNEYIRLSTESDVEGLKLFKEEIETSKEVIELGELKDAEGKIIKQKLELKDHETASENADEAIKNAMKSAGHPVEESDIDYDIYAKFAFKLGIDGFDDPKAGGGE